jgi:hypothetical protein
MRVIERGYGARLAFEALGEFLAQDLDRHDTVKPRISSLVNLAMPPAPIRPRIS